MKKFITLSVALFSVGLITLAGCSSGDEDIAGITDDNTHSNTTDKTVSKELTNASPTTTINNNSGVKLIVPQGAVPKAKDGSNAPLVFSIEKKSPPKNNVLPDGYSLDGDSWFIGPENFTFSKPLQIGLPVAVHQDRAYSLFHYNDENERWEPLASLRNSNTTSDVVDETPIPTQTDKLTSCLFYFEGDEYCIASYPTTSCTAEAIGAEGETTISSYSCIENGFSDDMKDQIEDGGKLYDIYIKDSVFLTAPSKRLRMSSSSDSYNWSSIHSAGYFIVGSRVRQTLATNPKKSGVVTIKNQYTSPTELRSLKYCIIHNKTFLKYPEQHIADYGVGGPGIVGDGQYMSSFADIELPQGEYVFQVERTKGFKGGLEHRAECDGWFETPSFNVIGKGEIIGTQSGMHVTSDKVIYVNNQASWKEGCAPCSENYPQPTALYGVGNIGITLTWSKKVDLDLHLTTPLGEEIFYDNEISKNQDIKLDVDRKCENIDEADLTENIYSPAGVAVPSGTYRVYVELYEKCQLQDSGCISFNVRTVVNGRVNTFTNKLCEEGEKIEIDNWVLKYNSDGNRTR